jgi:hypothetical protein
LVLLSKVVELKPGGLGSIVNAAWKTALVVVTSQGNFHLFEVPETSDRTGKTPFDAFKALYPSMDFDSPNSWVSGRKAEILRSLTPASTLNLRKCNMTISNLRKRQLDITEERSQTGGSRLMKAVNVGAQRQKKCTLRLPSATDASEWVAMLDKTKKELVGQAASKTSRFKF